MNSWKVYKRACQTVAMEMLRITATIPRTPAQVCDIISEMTGAPPPGVGGPPAWFAESVAMVTDSAEPAL